MFFFLADFFLNFKKKMLNKKMTMEATVHKIRDFDIDKYHQQLQKKNQQIEKDAKIQNKMAKILQEDKKMEKKILKARQTTIKKLKNLKNGDLVVFPKETGMRMRGVYIVRKTLAGAKLMQLSKEYDDYGHVNPEFSLSKEMPPGYWTYANLTQGNKQLASWNREENPEPIHKKHWKNIKPKDIESSRNDKEQIIDLGWVKLIFFLPKKMVLKLLKEKVLYFYCDESDGTDCHQMYLAEDFLPDKIRRQVL